jgi:hypothetical protein
MKPSGLAALAAITILAGCSARQIETATPAVPARPNLVPAQRADIPVERLVGNWGVASYREEKDKARTEKQARSFCNRPYSIEKGPTDGVMMHVNDDTKKYELTLKSGGGKTYLGFEGPAGDDQDREVLSISDSEFVLRYVNPEINTRYGTFIYVRCGQTARRR